MQEIGLEEDIRVAIVGAGGYGRVALDVLLAGGMGDRVLGFYDDAHTAISDKVRGYPVLGDLEMLKSMLSIEPVHVVVAISDNGARLRVRLGGGVGASDPGLQATPGTGLPPWQPPRRGISNPRPPRSLTGRSGRRRMLD